MIDKKTIAVFAGGLLVGVLAVFVAPADSGQPMGGPVGGPPGGEMGPPPEGGEGPLPPGEGHPPHDPLAAEAEKPADPVAEVTDTPARETTQLDHHMLQADSRWEAIGQRAAGVPQAEALVPRIEQLAADAPDVSGSSLPPVQELVVYLVEEKLLLDELAAAGVDVAEELESIDDLLTPRRGQKVGGADEAKHKGGASGAKPGLRPLDPDAPRDVGG